MAAPSAYACRRSTNVGELTGAYIGRAAHDVAGLFDPGDVDALKAADLRDVVAQPGEDEFGAVVVADRRRADNKLIGETQRINAII